jgi:hypothetical protein
MSPDKIALLMAYQFPPETLLLRASLSQQVKCNPIDNPVPLGDVAEVGGRIFNAQYNVTIPGDPYENVARNS